MSDGALVLGVLSSGAKRCCDSFADVSVTYGFTPNAVSTVPEPATWALMLAGFAGLGFAVRRRAQRAAA